MIIADHPGPWQQYHLRSDNRNLSVMELKAKYINEQYLFEIQMFNFQQYNIFMNGGGGGKLNEDTPSLSSLGSFSDAFSNAFNI